MTWVFSDRTEAGRLLAARLARREDARRAVVLGVPRGGIVVGAAVAHELGLPLEIAPVRRLCHPRHPERSLGVVDPSHVVFDEAAVERDEIPRAYLDEEVARLRAELQRLSRLVPRPGAREGGRLAIVCDDGISTGLTMAAAVRLARRQGPARVIAAAPVASPAGIEAVERAADEAVCVSVPERFGGVAAAYRRFEAVDDAEAARLLVQASAESAARG